MLLGTRFLCHSSFFSPLSPFLSVSFSLVMLHPSQCYLVCFGAEISQAHRQMLVGPFPTHWSVRAMSVCGSADDHVLTV